MSKKYRLPKEFADKWIAALESGEYKQCTGWLVNDGYCCLGVACKVAGIDDSLFDKNHFIRDTYIFSGVPSELYEKYEDQELDVSLSDTLSNLNDLELRDFDEIAAWIKENVELY